MTGHVQKGRLLWAVLRERAELCLCQGAGPSPAPAVKRCPLLCGAGEKRADLGLCLILRTALH